MVENNVNPTCTEKGSYDEVIYCTRCNEELSRVKKEVAALEHDYGEWFVKTEPTENEKGTRRRECTRCDSYQEEDILSLSESEWRIDTIYTNGGTREGINVVFENVKLNFSPIDASVGRMQEGYWVGVRFLAPVTVTSETINQVKYSNGSKYPDGEHAGELIWKSFANAKDGQTNDGRYYMQAWVPLTEATTKAAVEGKQNMVWTYKFATSGDITVTNDISITVIPENVELVKDGKTVMKYANWERVYKVTYLDEDEELISSEEVVSGDKLAKIPELEIPEGMCGYDFEYDNMEEDVALKDLVVTEDIEMKLYYYPHAYGEWTETVESTCTEKGTEERVCTHDNSHKETREIEALGHVSGDKVIENNVEPTCTEKGSYDEVIYCTRCNEELSRVKKEVAALEHDYGEWFVKTEPTENEKGTRRRECTRCDSYQEEDILSLSESEWRISHIFTPGGKLEENKAIFENLKLDFVPADPSRGRMVDGYWAGVKFLAPVTVTSETISQAKFSMDKGATWLSFEDSNDGLENGRYYMEAWVLVNEEKVRTNIAEKKNITWTFKFATSGDTENAEELQIVVVPENIELTKDGETVLKIQNWLEVHNLEMVAEKPATCTESGESAYWVCLDCSKKFSDENGENEIEAPSVLAPLGHSFGEWQIVKQATTEEEGKKERTCTRCGEKEEETIPKLEKELMKGDLDYSKEVTILDVRLLLQAYINSNNETEWSEDDMYIMDMDENGHIDILDVRLLLQQYINS